MDTVTKDFFDRTMGSLTMRGDVVKTEVSVRRVIEPGSGTTQTYTVQTFRVERTKEDRGGDTVFVEHTSAEYGFRRFVILPDVADIIARQRDAVGTKMRRRGAAKAKETKRARASK